MEKTMDVTRYKEKKLSHYDLVTGQIVGIEFKDGKKSFVQRVSHESFICASLNPDSGGSKIVGKSIPALIASIVSIKEIVLFDSPQELKEWL